VGACAGEAIGGRALGKRAMLLGAIAQFLPDTDFIPQIWLDNTEDLMAHRGFTHSILFGLISTFVLAIIAGRIYRNRPFTRKQWFLLFSVNIFMHIFIDTFNAYGTGWLEPFSDHRLSFHLLYVADPFFSIWPFIAFVILLVKKTDWLKRKHIAWAGLSLCGLYMIYAGVNKVIVDRKLLPYLAEKNIPVSGGNYIITPSPFNSWLWYIVVKDRQGYYVGYRSVFDARKETALTYFPSNDSLLPEVRDRKELSDLLRFAQNFYTVQKTNDTLVFNILRFGQVVGWYDPHEKFAFYYYLDRPEANELAVQRGRFERWNRESFQAFLRRIAGK
jgi:inner membrane protein